MKLIVGLGNPGSEYESTWHNLGFLLIDRLASRGGGCRFKSQLESKVAEVSIGRERALLVKPQTYMNLSGDSVSPLLRQFGSADPGNLIVVCDDVALPIGMIRVRASGSAGGQKGLKSIIERVGTQAFPRVRLGIRPDHPVSDLVKYVLSPMPKRWRQEVDEMIDRAADAVELIVGEGTAAAMQAFNRRVVSEDEPGREVSSPQA
ncbi:MAG TPA: aminoacyl-tRNA hydrolase [Blastocatellia bacterium]